MTLQFNAGLRLLDELLHVSSLFLLLFLVLILHLLISICTQFHHLFFGRLRSLLPWGLSLNTWFSCMDLSLLLLLLLLLLNT
jgi:hypothetical protein